MDYWAETMQDDCYLIAADGWKAGAQPREIVQVKNKDNKLVWPEPHDFKKGKRRFKSDLIPATILIARYFAAERDAIADIEAELAGIEQQLDEKREEQSGEEGLRHLASITMRMLLPLPCVCQMTPPSRCRMQVGPALVIAAQGHLLRQCEVVLLGVFPIHEMHRLVRLPSSDLHTTP